MPINKTEELEKPFIKLLFTYFESLVDAGKVKKGLDFDTLCIEAGIRQEHIDAFIGTPYLNNVLNHIRVQVNAWIVYRAYVECFVEIDRRLVQAIKTEQQLKLSAQGLRKEFNLVERFWESSFHHHDPHYGMVIAGLLDTLKLKCLACERYVVKRDDYNLLINSIFKASHELTMSYATTDSDEQADFTMIEHLAMEKAGTYFQVELAPKHRSMIYQGFECMSILLRDRVMYMKAKKNALINDRHNWQRKVLSELSQNSPYQNLNQLNLENAL